jgi:hypothetical protein
MIQGIGNLLSSVQVLNLNRGLYVISVKSGSPKRIGDDGALVLPAIHVGPAPGSAADAVDFMSGPLQPGQWLFEVGDTLIARVKAEQAVIVLTTMRAPTMATVEVEVARLDRGASTLAAAMAAAPPSAALPSRAAPKPDKAAALPPPLKTVKGKPALSVRLDMHIQRKGDVSYTNTFWSGALGERCAVEGFAIQPLADLRADQIEYSAVAENGQETGWITGGMLCGSRGLGLALSGFSIRIRPEAQARFQCEYRGAFASGRILGPSRNGAPCKAEAGDRLEAIQLFILPRDLTDVSAEQPAPALPAPPPRVIGPRFSVFRETAE